MGLALDCWHYSYLKNFIVWSLVLTLVQANSDHVSLLFIFLIGSNNQLQNYEYPNIQISEFYLFYLFVCSCPCCFFFAKNNLITLGCQINE